MHRLEVLLPAGGRWTNRRGTVVLARRDGEGWTATVHGIRVLDRRRRKDFGKIPARDLLLQAPTVDALRLSLALQERIHCVLDRAHAVAPRPSIRSSR